MENKHKNFHSGKRLAISVILLFLAFSASADISETDYWIQKLKHSKSSVRNEAADALITIGTPAVEPLIELLKNENPDTRAIAASCLGHIKNPIVINPLITAIQDKEEKVMASAAKALQEIDTTSKSPLIVALKHENLKVRIVAATILGKLKYPEAIYPLIEVLDDRVTEVRKSAVESLGMIGKPAVKPLIETVKKDTSREKMALLALGRTKESAALDVLLLKVNDPDPDIRAVVAIALGQIPDRRVVDPLLTALNDRNQFVKLAAISALGQTRSLKAAGPLLDLLSSNNSLIRGSVTEALGNINKDVVVKPLISVLEDSDPEIRVTAAMALSKIQDMHSLKPLLDTLEDKEPEVRRAAVFALGELQDASAIESLIDMFSDENKAVRLESAKALAKIGEPAVGPLVDSLNKSDDLTLQFLSAEALRNIGQLAVKPMIRALNSQNENKRMVIWFALATIKDPPIQPLISAVIDHLKVSGPERLAIAAVIENLGPAGIEAISVAKERDSETQKGAIEVLGYIETTQAIDELIKIAEDKNSSVRLEAINALVMTKDHHIVKPFIAILKDRSENDHLRVASCNALSYINDPVVIDAFMSIIFYEEDYLVKSFVEGHLSKFGSAVYDRLTNMLEDEDYKIRKIAVSALRSFNTPQAIEKLISSLHDEHPQVRAEAAASLRDIKEERALKPLLSMILTEEDSSVIISAASALRNIDSSSVKLLVPELKNSNARIRRNAAAAIGYYEDSNTVSFLASVLANDPNSIVRKAAASALGHIKDNSAVKPLIDALSDEQVRIYAINSLGNLKDSSAVQNLIETTHNKDFHVRVAASRALSKINDEQAVDFLMQALKNKDYDIIMGAIVFFIGRGLEGTEPILIEAVKKDCEKRYNKLELNYFYNSGNDSLKKAAVELARTYNWELREYPYNNPVWGKPNPDLIY